MAALAALLSLHCGRSRPPTEVGALALTIPAVNAEIRSIHFEVNATGFSRAGDIDVSSPLATPSLLIGGIPAGGPADVTLSGVSTDGRTNCRGSATAAVAANSTTPVTVTLACRTVGSAGGVIVNGSFNQCPAFVSLAATPAMTSVGPQDVIEVAAQAEDRDNMPLAFAWTASAGVFDQPDAAATVFRCAAPGPVAVTVIVSDGSCHEMVSATLICLPFCTNKADGTTCNDEDACTQRDQCLAGSCTGGDPVQCTALDGCHVAGECTPNDGTCSQPAAPDGASCPLPNASATCQGGACAVVSCTAGLGNCNQVATDGCETVLDSDVHCGACARACGGGTHCQTGACLSPPPTRLLAQAGGWQVALSWGASPSATSYDVLRANGPAAAFHSIGLTGATVFMDLGVVTGVSYRYAIVAINAEGRSQPSAPALATPATKQICVNSNSKHSVFVFGADQTGAATPVRVLGGSIATLGFPTALASSLANDELLVMRRGGVLDVFPLSAAGTAPPVRTLAGAAPAGTLFALDVDEAAGEVFTAAFSPGGRLLTLDRTSGTVLRLVEGPMTTLGNPSSVVLDGPRGELFISTAGPESSPGGFPRVLVFDKLVAGDVAPKRVLGMPGGATVGRWVVGFDRARDQLLTSCNCNNRLTAFHHAASGDAAPLRTLELPPAYAGVYALLMDEGADTVWVVARNQAAEYVLMELPRGGNGAVAPLRAPILLSSAGHLARCN